MRILFCTYGFVDYGLDVLYDGLCRVLGPENVLEYPHKPSLHGVRRNSYLWYPCFFDWPAPVSDAEKLDLLRAGGFDAVLVGCNTGSDFTRRRERGAGDDPALRTARELLVAERARTPIYLVDMGDTPGINTALLAELDAARYFKREYPRGADYGPRVTPLNFAYAEQYAPAAESAKRANALFWAGQVYPERAPFVAACEERRGRPFFNRWKQASYSARLARHTIGLSLPGYGWDTARYYEIPAHGALLFARRPQIVIEHDFSDGENAVFFDDVGDMLAKLDYLLTHEVEVDRLRAAGAAWQREHHTSAARARQMLNRVKETTCIS